ncbi:hypothetical protein CCHR01_09487 [Colletotrichum chrysophilum]|uniref:Uncharacterized protein n=1 Tax=Colletotrichum chrysophilum TaxID=1836956 RepID=A0AAD9AJL6_9PEZI|nr:hypothetical protein CCHR01_09487 [Colletotrichum chrysophilum]
MHRVTEDLNKQHLTDENIKGIERLGITVKVEVEGPEEEDYYYKPGYWIKELDKLME